MNTILFLRQPSLIDDWGYVEDWAAGDSVAPSGWTMAGTAGSVAKESTIVKYGSYSMKIISGSSNSYKATISTITFDNYVIGDNAGKTITFGMWIYCGTADKARIYIYDGTTTTNSSYHTGVAGWEFITVEAQIGAANTELTFGCEVVSSTITAYFDGGVACVGELTTTDMSAYISDWSPTIKQQFTSFEIAKNDGVYIPNVQFREKTLKLKGSIAESSEIATRNVYDTLLGAVNNGEKDLLLQDDRIVSAFLTRQSHQYKSTTRMIMFNWDFIAQTPFLRYISKTRKISAISSSPTSFDLEVTGKHYTFPRITFTQSGNALESCTLENLTTKESFSFTGTVADGDKLIIDNEKLAVENDTVDAIADFTGVFFKLVPGTNYLKFTGSDTTIHIDWYNRWVL